MTPAGRYSPDAEGLSARSQALIRALKHLTPEMAARLESLKQDGRDLLDRPDWIWHALLGSFSTMGGSRGHEGLIKNQDNYEKVTYRVLSELSPAGRRSRLESVLRDAKVRMPARKARWLAENFEFIRSKGGLEATKDAALRQPGKDGKIAFMRQFAGVGPKYARNIWMDVYHPDFYQSVAIDARIKSVSDLLGVSFATYEEHEEFYLRLAKEAGLQGWALDRLLYNFHDDLCGAIRSAFTEQSRRPFTPAGAESASGTMLDPSTEARWRALIRDVPDFPQPGVLFRDITPLLHDPAALRGVNDALAEAVRALRPTVVAGIEARGFIFGVPVAERLGLPFVPVRKPGKLPAAYASVAYALEYGEAELQLHHEPSVRGQRVVVVDDLLATGGTAEAAGRLVAALGGTVAGYAFCIELTALGGRERLRAPVIGLIRF